jgi:hypothetical protein
LAAAPALVIYALEGEPCLAYEFEMVQSVH